MRTNFVISMIILVMFSLFVAGCTNTSTTIKTTTGVQTPTTETESHIKTYTLNRTASDSVSSLTVDSVKFVEFKDLNDSQTFEKYVPGGHVVMMHITFRNLQKSEAINAPFAFTLVDNAGNTYGGRADSYLYSPYNRDTPAFNPITILPGETRSGYIGFLVPTTASGLTYRYPFNNTQIAVFKLQ